MASGLTRSAALPTVTRLVPALFVLLWSTGFIGAKLGLPFAQPLTFLALRYALVLLLLVPVAVLTGARWPRTLPLVGHLALVGVLVHGIYLAGVFVAIAHGMSAGTAALIVSLQPILVSALAAPFLGERLVARQWLGLALGLSGCVLVVFDRLAPGSWSGIVLCLGSLLAITAGTLYQKRFCTGVDVQAANVVQFAAAFSLVAPLAWATETGSIQWTPSFVFALFWLVVVLSLGAVSLLLLLIRAGAASRVSSLFFLVPPTTALIAFLVFRERMSLLELAGMLVAVAGVALVNLRAR